MSFSLYTLQSWNYQYRLLMKKTENYYEKGKQHSLMFLFINQTQLLRFAKGLVKSLINSKPIKTEVLLLRN